MSAHDIFVGGPMTVAEPVPRGTVRFDEDTDELILRSGRRIYANCGILGINPVGQISGGYDEGLNGEEFSEAERNEIASYMIGLWREWGKL